MAIERSSRRHSHLIEECECLCAALGFGHPSKQVLTSYLSAHQTFFGNNERNDDEIWGNEVKEAIWRGDDLEALEYALRWSSPSSVLRKKVHLLVYLLESNPGAFDAFHRREDRRFGAWITLAFYTLRSAYILLKGRMIAWRLARTLTTR